MAVTNTVSIEYKNKLYNGNSYTDNPSKSAVNLVGNAMTQIQASISINIGWGAESDAFDAWDLTATTITGVFTDFEAEGFRVGQVFDYYPDRDSPADFRAIIDSISVDKKRITFTVSSGAVTPATDIDTGIIIAVGNDSANQFAYLAYRFGLPTNDEEFTIESRISGNDNRYSLQGLTGVLQPLEAQGTLKDWQTGTAQARLASSDDVSQTYEIVHEFIIAPWVLANQVEDLQALSPPDYFAGVNCLRHCFEVELRPTASFPYDITTRVDDIEGFTGWFNENLNGLTPQYSLSSIAYEDVATNDAVEGLQNTKRTQVTITLQGSFVAGQRVGLLHSAIPNQDDYTNKTTDAIGNFLYDNLYIEEGSSVSGLGIIKDLQANITGSDLVLVAELEYTNDEAQFVQSLNYLLAVDIANPTLNPQTSDAVSVLADVREYVTTSGNVQGLMSVSDFGILFRDQLESDNTSDFVGYNSDAIQVFFDAELDTSKQAVFESLEVRLIADNQGQNKSFELDRYTFDLSSAVVSGVSQLIEIDIERAYPYPSGNRYDKVIVSSGALVGSLQPYRIEIGQKIRWEDWLSNLQADTAFYDANDPNNNLNFKSSNYSLLNGYEIRIELLANVRGVDDAGIESVTVYSFKSSGFDIKDFGFDQGFSGVIETFELLSNDDLGGAISANSDTLVRAIFTPTTASIVLSKGWAAIRLQEFGNSGQQLFELSTSYATDNNSPLQPKQGESFLTLVQSAGQLIAEGVIKAGTVNAQQFIVARYDQTPPFVFEFVTTAQTIEFFIGGTDLTVTMVLPDNTQVVVTPNTWFLYDFGSVATRRVGFLSNDPLLWESVLISRQDQSGNSIIGNLDFTDLHNVTTVEAQNNQVDSLVLGDFIQNAGLQAEFHSNNLDSSAVIQQLIADNNGVNQAGRIFTLFDNSNITLDDVPSIQLIEVLGLNVIIALWALENE